MMDKRTMGQVELLKLMCVYVSRPHSIKLWLIRKNQHDHRLWKANCATTNISLLGLVPEAGQTTFGLSAHRRMFFFFLRHRQTLRLKSIFSLQENHMSFNVLSHLSSLIFLFGCVALCGLIRSHFHPPGEKAIT